MTQADLARQKLDLLCDALANRLPVGDHAWDLIDGVYEDVDKLERKAYLVVPTPRTLLRRLRGRAA